MRNAILISAFIFLMAACSSGNMKYDASGTFEATEVVVSAEAQGKLMEFNIQEGDTVRAGETLGYIDSIQLDLKKLNLLASNRALVSRKSDISKQLASLDEEIVKQKREYDRFENMFTNGAATSKQVDDLKAQLLVLEKQREALLSTLTRGNESVSAESTAMEIQVSQLNDQLSKCVISSPITGNILTKYAEVGELMSIGKPLFKVANMNNIFIRAYFTSTQLEHLKLNQKVQVIADFGGDNERKYDGRISWIADKSEFTPKSIQTKDERANLVYPVKVEVKNDGTIKIGMYGWVEL